MTLYNHQTTATNSARAYELRQQGMSHKQIAKEMGIAVQRVAALLVFGARLARSRAIEERLNK